MPRKPVAFRVLVRTLPKASRQTNGPQAQTVPAQPVPPGAQRLPALAGSPGLVSS